jgi:DNA-binding MarR family transcriptional regulator
MQENHYGSGMERDEVAGIVEAWARERPDLDLSRFEVSLRLSRVARAIAWAIDQAGIACGLDEGQWSVLAALRRQGPPFQLTPTELSQTTACTSGAMTKRIDRLERAGLVARTPDLSDRRGVLVSLTSSGLAAADTAATATFAAAHAAMGTLSDDERDMLARLLRTMLTRLEGA